MPTSVLAAYALARLEFAGKRLSTVILVLPLVAPGLVTATAFTTTEQLRVVPVAIVGYMSAWGTDYSGMNAAATLAMLPPPVFFPAVQRWFVQGLLAGSAR